MELTPFDTVVSQLLILSILVATAARAGVAEDGPTAALQVREIEPCLAPGEAVLANVVLRIEISGYKGNQYVS
jgi:hypothetical protein